MITVGTAAAAYAADWRPVCDDGIKSRDARFRPNLNSVSSRRDSAARPAELRRLRALGIGTPNFGFRLLVIQQRGVIGQVEFCE